MTWKAEPVSPDRVDARYLYELSKKHRMVPSNIVDAISYYRALADDCAALVIVDDAGEKIADLIITDIVDGESAELNLIPNAKHFAPGEDYAGLLNEAMGPVLSTLMNGRHLRRVSSFVPKTRSRTAKALRSCGFKKEGVMRDALQFEGQDVQDMVIMGLLSKVS